MIETLKVHLTNQSKLLFKGTRLTIVHHYGTAFWLLLSVTDVTQEGIEPSPPIFERKHIVTGLHFIVHFNKES